MKSKFKRFVKRYIENSKDPVILMILVLTIIATILIATGKATLMQVEYPLLLMLLILPPLSLTIMDLKNENVK